MSGERSESTARLLRPVFAAIVGGHTDPPPPRSRRRRRLVIGGIHLGSVIDSVLTLILFVTGYASLNANGQGDTFVSFAVLISTALGSVALLMRGSRPLRAWRLSLLAIVLAKVLLPTSVLTTPYPPTLGIAYLLCLYSVAVRCERAVTAGAMIISTVGCVLLDSRTAAFSLLCGVPLLLGYTVRVRRTAKRTLAEQEARHAEERAVLQERQRIARELHDVVAHHMSVIAIQAEAAPYKVAEPPPELAESFADIRASALEGLRELRRILGVLRTDDQAQTAPQPGLERLEDVVASARNGGLAVETRVTGQATVLPQGVGLSAHRILQETLSNAMRHAPGASVRVDISYSAEALRLGVVNGPARTPQTAVASGGGHGLVGMRERVAMLGGDLHAGPTPEGGFAVFATLPLRNGDTSGPVAAGTPPERTP